MQNAVSPPGKTAFLFYLTVTHTRGTQAKFDEHITNTRSIHHILRIESGVMPIFV